MCGIAGIVGHVTDLEYRLAGMVKAQEHRGGKDWGFWVSSFVDSQLGIAHGSRIVSKTEEYVKQPYVDSDTRLVVAMDGEIYNGHTLRKELQQYYSFTTDSTVEIVAKAYHRWGEDCLQHFEGTFAFVIYDRDAEELLLVRDRFGVKPLYYATYHGVLFFASEINTLFAAGIRRQLSAERWAGYMIYSSYGAPYETFWDGVHQLPAGFLLRYNGYSLQEKGWYDLLRDVEQLVNVRDVQALEAQFLDEIERSATRCISDVTSCGFRKTGRIESQMLYALASVGMYDNKVRTYTHVVPIRESHLIPAQEPDEPVWLPASQVIEELENMSHWVEEPFDGSESVIRTAMLRQAYRGGMKVMCSGVGLDVMWQDVWDKSEISYNYLTPPTLFSRPFVMLATRPRYHLPFESEADNLRYLDLYYERIPHILRFFDRLAADVGVQIRLPFLNNHLVALSFALPAVLRIGRKEIFDRCISARYEVEYHRQEEQSMLPIWLGDGMIEWVGDTLADLRNSEVRDWFDVAHMEQNWWQFREGNPIDVALLWKCISLHSQLYQK